MNNLFNMDGPLFRFLSKVADLMILNIIFLISCIPIVTIGASITALSYVTLKMKDGEEGYVFKTFFRSFRENFKQATLIWLMMLVLAVVMAVDFLIIGNMEGTMSMVMKVLVGMGALIWLMEFTYVFPLQSRFYNTIKGTLQNALLLAIANFPKTFCMMAVTIFAVLATLWNSYTVWYGLLVWILLGFAVISWINSHFLHGIFKKLMPAQEEEEETEDGEVSPEMEDIRIKSEEIPENGGKSGEIR